MRKGCYKMQQAPAARSFLGKKSLSLSFAQSNGLLSLLLPPSPELRPRSLPHPWSAGFLLHSSSGRRRSSDPILHRADWSTGSTPPPSSFPARRADGDHSRLAREDARRLCRPSPPPAQPACAAGADPSRRMRRRR
jgi:hypothetical protein